MDIDHTIAQVKIGDWVLSVIETIDNHSGKVMDREFLCTSRDMKEPFPSLVEAIEFIQSLTGKDTLNAWVYVELLSKQAQDFYVREGLSV